MTLKIFLLILLFSLGANALLVNIAVIGSWEIFTTFSKLSFKVNIADERFIKNNINSMKKVFF